MSKETRTESRGGAGALFWDAPYSLFLRLQDSPLCDYKVMGCCFGDGAVVVNTLVLCWCMLIGLVCLLGVL